MEDKNNNDLKGNLSEDTKRVQENGADMLNDREKELALLRQKEDASARLKMMKEEERKRERERKLAERNSEIANRKKEKASLRYKKIRQKEKRLYEKENGNNNKRPSIGGWITAVVSLGLVCLVLSSILIYDVFMKGGGETMLSNVYARSFYSLVDYVNNVDVNLSKLTTSNDNENKQKILCDIIVEANLAETSLSSLPLEDNSKRSTEKYLNQLGDFSKYLNNKLIEGDSLSEGDLKTLFEMKKINATLCEKLNALQGELAGNFDFITLLSGEENAILNSFNQLEYHSVEYPKMIYDGPFADEDEVEEKSSDNKKPLKEISNEEAIKIFENSFASYNPTEISITGNAISKNFKLFNVEAKSGEESIFSQITQDGKIASFMLYKHSKDKKFNRDECVEKGYEFLKKCGYKSIKAVWSTQGKDNVTYINFASTLSNGQIIAYADLIKVGVCMEDGVVCDMDAHQYIENHKERKIEEVKLRVEDAERKISQDIEVETSRLAIIPLQNGTEKLAYEFYGKGSEGTFYIYIDAVSGKELQIFKVVSGSDGDLLL